MASPASSNSVSSQVAAGRPLRVLFAVRADLEQYPGGDTVQILNTARELRNLGVDVRLTHDPRASLDGVDCLHLWHLERVHDSYVFFEKGQQRGLPMVLSPIYWPFRDAPAAPIRSRCWKEQAKNIYRFIRAGNSRERRVIARVLRVGWSTCRQRLLTGVNMLLPNSQAEADVLRGQTSPNMLIQVAPNGIDPSQCRLLQPGDCLARSGILSVGHFDPRKNQLLLVRALRGLGENVTLVGGARRLHRRYYRRCLAEADGQMFFTGAMPHDAVLRRMAGSCVHVCPSLAETPGLINLEAAMMGCVLVLPDCPPVREYFGEMALYFQPDSPESLRGAVQQALSSTPCPQLRDHILEHFTWKHAALATLDAYRKVIG